MSGIGRGIPSKILSKIRDNKTGSGLLVTAHQNNNYCANPLANTHTENGERLQGNLRAVLSLIACCGTLSFTVYHSYVCTDYVRGMPATRSVAPGTRGREERDPGMRESRCQGPMDEQGVWMRISHAQGYPRQEPVSPRGRDLRESSICPRQGRHDTPAAGWLARGEGGRGAETEQASDRDPRQGG